VNELRGLLVGGGALLLAALLLWVLSRWMRKRSGIPAGRVVYADTGSWRECVEPLLARDANVTGKPDYLVRKLNYWIPVEVKSGRAPPEPYRSHVLQLAAYCLIVDEVHGRRPPYGLIHYDDRTFAVNYTPELEDELLDTIEWMREDMRDGQADRNHNDPARCRSCSMAEFCDQRLG
jgi:CRISPR-associated exonuclease Cas4